MLLAPQAVANRINPKTTAMAGFRFTIHLTWDISQLLIANCQLLIEFFSINNQQIDNQQLQHESSIAVTASDFHLRSIRF